MVSLQTPLCDFDLPAPDFNLPGVDGRRWTRDDCMGDKGLLVMFICNHCPYVKAVIHRILRDARELAPLGIRCVAIMSTTPPTIRRTPLRT
jgi:thiol-disulfide isomerase/thioredoxin